METYHKKFISETEVIKGQSRSIPEEIIGEQARIKVTERDGVIAPLERQRARILSRIPFFK